MTTFYISDTHAYHQNILQFEPGRTHYESVEEMNEDLIDKWNSVVSKNDTVYHLGDVSFGGKERLREFLDRLNGKIILLKGNHDHTKDLKYVHDLLQDIRDFHSFKTHGYRLLLCHYPVDIGLRKKMFNIHGHIHSHKSRLYNQVNVGVDALLPKYLSDDTIGRPVAEEELIKWVQSIEKVIDEDNGYSRYSLYK